MAKFNYMFLRSILLFSISIFLMGCPSSPEPNPVPPTPVDPESSFNDYVDKGFIENEQLDEASGLIASRKNPGYFWAHNDSNVALMPCSISTSAVKSISECNLVTSA